MGTALISHSFPLNLYRYGPIKHLYVQGGQPVRKGEFLLKDYDHTLLMATTAGIVTEFSDASRTHRLGAEPIFFFTEGTPFRLRLLASPATDALVVGR